jgi:hypothetical protein
MVVQMTRAEYEAKYGSKPAAPAPAQMTRSQYAAKYGTSPASTTPAAPQQGLFSRIKTGVQQSFQERDAKVQEAAARVQSGERNLGQGLLRGVGQAAGLVTDAAFTAAKETVRSVAPSAIPAAKRTLGAVMQTAPVQKATQAYSGFKERHPETAEAVEDIANIAGVLPTVKGAQIGAKAGAKAALTTAEVGIKGAEKAGKAAAKAPASAASNGVGSDRGSPLLRADRIEVHLHGGLGFRRGGWQVLERHPALRLLARGAERDDRVAADGDSALAGVEDEGLGAFTNA